MPASKSIIHLISVCNSNACLIKTKQINLHRAYYVYSNNNTFMYYPNTTHRCIYLTISIEDNNYYNASRILLLTYFHSFVDQKYLRKQFISVYRRPK